MINIFLNSNILKKNYKYGYMSYKFELPALIKNVCELVSIDNNLKSIENINFESPKVRTNKIQYATRN